MPVNISLARSPRRRLVVEAHVVAEAGDVDELQPGCVGDRRGTGEAERGAAVGAEHGRRDVGDEPVDQPGVEQRARELRAALDQRLQHAEPGEELERGGEIDADAVRGGRHRLHLGAGGEPRAGRRRRARRRW